MNNTAILNPECFLRIEGNDHFVVAYSTIAGLIFGGII